MKKLLLLLLTAVAIQVNAQPTSGLVAYWRMNGNFNDSTSNAINGTAFGNPPDTLNNLNQPVKAKRFNNPTGTAVQYVTLPINSLLNFSGTQNFTVSFAFCMTSPWVHNGGFIDNNLNYGGYGVYIWNGGAGGTIVMQFNYKNASVASTVIPMNVWKYACAVRDNGVLRIYVDGVLSNSTSEGSMTPSYTYNTRIGSMFFNAQSPPQYNPLHGTLDEMRIYNRALSQAEITQLYNVWINPPVPVKLSSFTAAKNKNDVLLQWQTQYEQNSSHFTIQRSADGTTFTDVARVNAAGNSASVKNYQYTDILPATMQLQKTIFYRLQQVDVGGKFAYSQVLAIHAGKKDMKLFVSPNPAKDILHVQTGGDIAGNASLQIINSTGSITQLQPVVLNAGINIIPINISALAAGAYTVKLVSSNSISTKQFIKQ